MVKADLSDNILFLSYNVRPGIDIPGYESWLNEIDNPFFNSISTIGYYANWKIIEGFYNLPFSMFDFMSFRQEEDMAASWANPKLTEFTGNWEKLWGNDPAAADKSVNYQVGHFQRQIDASTSGAYCALTFDQGDTTVHWPGCTQWARKSAVVGPGFGRRLTVGFYETLDAARDMAKKMGGAVGAVVAHPG